MKKKALTRRDRLLALARGIKGIQFCESAGVELDDISIGSSKGLAMVLSHDRTVGAKGGFSLCGRSISTLKGVISRESTGSIERAKAHWDDWRADFEPKFVDAVAMVVAGCQPDVKYFRLALGQISLQEVLRGEALGKYLFYEKTRKVLDKRWREYLKQALNPPASPWAQMDERELEVNLANEFSLDLDD